MSGQAVAGGRLWSKDERQAPARSGADLIHPSRRQRRAEAGRCGMTAEPRAERQPRIRMGKSWRSRRQRAELLAAIQGFECALAGCPHESTWQHGVAAELGRLRAAFDQHVALTEGPD